MKPSIRIRAIALSLADVLHELRRYAVKALDRMLGYETVIVARVREVPGEAVRGDAEQLLDPETPLWPRIEFVEQKRPYQGLKRKQAALERQYRGIHFTPSGSLAKTGQSARAGDSRQWRRS